MAAHDRDRGRRWSLRILLVCLWIVFAAGWSILDVTERFSRVYGLLSERMQPLRMTGQTPGQPRVALLSEGEGECDAAFPAHGRTHRFAYVEPSHWARQSSRVFVTNGHAYPVALLLTDLAGEEEFEAVMLHPGRGAQIAVPVGDYGVIALSGLTWCNLADGFTDGVEVRAPQNLAIQPDHVARLGLRSYGTGPGDMMFSFGQSLGVAAATGIEGFGNLVLHRHGMHYLVEGTVNDTPLTFMVDTGASITTVSREFARQAGLGQCVPHQTRTANGIATACKAVARELSLGQFQLQGVDVDIMDNPGMPLLGMNVIGRFRMEQQGDVMRLSVQ